MSESSKRHPFDRMLDLALDDSGRESNELSEVTDEKDKTPSSDLKEEMEDYAMSTIAVLLDKPVEEIPFLNREVSDEFKEILNSSLTIDHRLPRSKRAGNESNLILRESRTNKMISSDIDSVDNESNLKTCIITEIFLSPSGGISDRYEAVYQWEEPLSIQGIYMKEITSLTGTKPIERYLVDVNEQTIFNWLLANPDYSAEIQHANRLYSNQGIDFELTIQKKKIRER